MSSSSNNNQLTPVQKATLALRMKRVSNKKKRRNSAKGRGLIKKTPETKGLLNRSNESLNNAQQNTWMNKLRKKWSKKSRKAKNTPLIDMVVLQDHTNINLLLSDAKPPKVEIPLPPPPKVEQKLNNILTTKFDAATINRLLLDSNASLKLYFISLYLNGNLSRENKQWYETITGKSMEEIVKENVSFRKK